MLTIQSPGARGDLAAYPLKKGSVLAVFSGEGMAYMASRTGSAISLRSISSVLKP